MKQGPLRALAAVAALALVPLGAGSGLRAQVVVVVGPRATAIPLLSPGDTVTVPIVADVTGAGGAALGAITAQLSWRPNTLRFLGAGAGAVGVPALNADSASGTLRFALATASGVTGLPVLLQARFQAIGPARDSTTLGLTVSELTAAGTFAPLTPALTTALVCIGHVARWGDLTGDDQVMSNDALAIVTYAVGLPIAPLTPTDGDVDSDGRVETRDALIVLSFAVGLPTPGFRVNQVRSLCGSGSPAASVAVSPGAATLVTGDQLPLAATVRDAGGAIVHANPAWLTRNAAVATVDRAGVVQAVGAGTTRIVVAAVPGIMDSTTVTVGGTRQVWYVDAGASSAVQNGSLQFPFATIPQAVLAAAPDDTIRLAVGTYGSGLRLRKPMVVLGDSTAAGFPAITLAGGAGIDIDSIAAGQRVTVRRLRVRDAGAGVAARGLSGTVELDRVIIERSRDEGLSLVGLDSARLTGVAVAGAVGYGVKAESTRVVLATGLTVDAIAPLASGAAFSVWARHVDTLVADTVDLRVGAVFLDSTGVVDVAHGFLGYAFGTILTVNAASTATIDSLTVAGSPANVSGLFAARITMTAGGTVELNGVVVDGGGGAALHVNRAQQLTMRGGRVTGADTTLLVVDSTPVVGLHGLEVTGASFAYAGLNLFSYAIRITVSDSVALDSLWIHDNGGGAAWVDSSRVIRMYGSRLEDNHLQLQAGQGVTSVNFTRFRRARVAQTVVDHGAAAAVGAASGLAVFGVRGRFDVGGSRLQVDSTTVLGGQAVRAVGASRTLNDTLGLIGLRAAPALGSRTSGVYAISVGRLEAQDLDIDSTAHTGSFGQATAIYGEFLGSFSILNSRFSHVAGAVYARADTVAGTNPGPGVFSGNSIDCDTTYSQVQYVVSLNQVGPVTVTNNVQQPSLCILGIVAANQFGGAPQRSAVVTDNQTSAPTASGGTALSLQGAYVNAVVARNVTTPGVLLVSGLGLGNDSARIDSNVVRGTFRGGIWMSGPMRALSMRGNVVDSIPATSTFAGITLPNTSGTVARLVGNTVKRAAPSALVTGAVDTVYLDSNVIVDSPVGVRLSLNHKVVGRRNFIARNDTALVGFLGSFVRMDTSVIHQSTTARGALNLGTTTWELADNYWGDPLGPRCLSLCNPASLGDSILGPANFATFLASPPGTPVGAPPALRPAPARSAAVAGLLRAGATLAVDPPGRHGRTRPRVALAPTAAPPVAPHLLPGLPPVIW